MKLPNDVTKEITGHSTSSGVLAKLKAAFGRGPGDRWLILTNTQNPLLKDYDRFNALVAQELTNATATQVPTKNLLVSGSVPIARIEPRMATPVGP